MEGDYPKVELPNVVHRLKERFAQQGFERLKSRP